MLSHHRRCQAETDACLQLSAWSKYCWHPLHEGYPLIAHAVLLKQTHKFKYSSSSGVGLQCNASCKRVMVGSITWRVSAHCTRTFSRIPPLAGRTYSTQHFTTSAFLYNSTHALMSCQCQILNKSVLLACYYYSHPVLMNCQLTFSYSTLLLSLIHIWRCRRYSLCRSRWSPYH